MNQWDLWVFFGLLLFLSSSKGAETQTSNSHFAFLLQDLHPGGGGRRKQGLQRRRLVHRQLTVASGRALGNNDSEKLL